MPETDLNILLKVIDEASEPIKTAITGIKGETAKLSEANAQVGKTGREAAQGITKGFKEASNQLRDFRKTMFFVTAAFATMVVSINEAAKYSEEAKESMDDFKRASSGLSAQIGAALIPVLDDVSYAVEKLSLIVEAAIAGFYKLKAISVSIAKDSSWNPLKAGEDIKRALEEGNRAADEYLKKAEDLRARINSGRTLESGNKIAGGITSDINKIENIASETIKKPTIETFKVDKSIIDDINEIEKIVTGSTTNMKSGWEGVASSVETLGASLANAEELGKGYAKAAAAIGIAMAIINTAEGVTRAFKDYKWPFSMVVAGIIAAAGAIQIATIAAQKFHEGGIIKAHDGLAVGEVPIIAQTGEGILSRRGMANLGGEQVLNRLNKGESTGGSGVYVTVNYPKMTSKEEVSELAKILGLEINRQLRYSRGV